MYNTIRRRQYPTKLVITNHREHYWLEDHIKTYIYLRDVAKVRALTPKELHLFDICFRALKENHLEKCY